MFKEKHLSFHVLCFECACGTLCTVFWRRGGVRIGVGDILVLQCSEIDLFEFASRRKELIVCLDGCVHLITRVVGVFDCPVKSFPADPEIELPIGAVIGARPTSQLFDSLFGDVLQPIWCRSGASTGNCTFASALLGCTYELLRERCM